MKYSVYTSLAATLALAAAGYGHAQPVLLAQSNISQNQSGWGNSQSISIGNTDGTQASKKTKGKAKRVSSTNKDPETGNTQSADVGGKTPSVAQTQTGANRQQSVTMDGKKVDTK